MSLVAIIAKLAPHLGQALAVRYAIVIRSQARRVGIDPYLIPAIVWRESRFRRKARRGKNHGLLQLRISATTNPTRQPADLYRGPHNLRLGIRTLPVWRAYHYAICRPHQHHWWAHWQHGAIVRDRGSGDRVAATYRQILRWRRGLKGERK